MAKSRVKKNFVSLPDAIADAKKMMRNDGSMPLTLNQLAERWGCSAPRVSIILRDLRNGHAGKKTRSTALKKDARVNVGVHPLLHRLSKAIAGVGDKIADVSGHIAAIPGLPPAEQKQLSRKAHSGIWNDFGVVLSKTIVDIQNLAKIKRAKRKGRKSTRKAK